VRHVPPNTLMTRGEAWTIGLTYFTVAITVSVVHSTAGTEPWVIVAATLLVNSATATLAYAAVTTAGGGAVAGVLSGWLVSTRFGLMAAALGPRLWPSRWKRAVAAFSAFDPNVALALRERTDSDARRVYVSASLWLVLPWWTGAMLGVIIGEHLGDPRRLGLDALFPALFIAIIWPQLKSRTALSVGLLGAVIALAAVEPMPGGLPVLLAALAALLAMKDRRSC
jgi:predicted branched-subunit amino acid permease